MSKNKNFFPHPLNLRHDPRMRRIMKDLRETGYAAILWIFEVVGSQKDFKYKLNDIDLISDESGISLAILDVSIKNYGFFEIIKDANGEFFFSPLLNELMLPYCERKEARSQAGQISAKKRELERLAQIEELRKKLSAVNSNQQNPTLLPLSEDDSSQQIREDIDHSSQFQKSKFYKEKKPTKSSSFKKSIPDQVFETEDAIIAIHNKLKTTVKG